MTGQYGGAVFLLFYLLFLAVLGLPVLIMEFAVGRAARLNMGHAFRKLEPEGTKWHSFGWLTIAGCYLLMMFYIPVAGWMFNYMAKGATGQIMAGGAIAVQDYTAGLFSAMLKNPSEMAMWTLIVSVLGFGICGIGLRKGVERITKYMMAGLLIIMVGLAVYSLTLKDAGEGLRFYLMPDWPRAFQSGIWPLVSAAMNQAFFTLSVGIGSMCIFGSYLGRERTLTQESLIIVGLDTFVALTAGLIIFPACFAFGFNPGAGPGMIFITLPCVFNSMAPAAGRFFGFLFFVFMSMAALTTVVAVVENCIAYFMDGLGWSRRKSTFFNFVLLTLLTLPCIFGFNIWESFSIPKIGGVLEIEDFLVSNTLLPFGALVFCLFCTSRYGWGWKNFIAETDTGSGLKFPKFLRFYITWILPLVLAALLIIGYWQTFTK